MIKDLDDIDDAYINFKMFDSAQWNLVLSNEIADKILQTIQG